MNRRPKRRKDKYNPYTLIEDKELGKYFVTFKDNKKVFNIIEITKEIYDIFDYYELRDLSYMNEYDNHIEHSLIYEDKINSRSIIKSFDLENYLIKKFQREEIFQSIEKLSNIQKKRIIKYFFKDMTEKEIAEEEKVSQQSVHISLNRAKIKLKEILTKMNLKK